MLITKLLVFLGLKKSWKELFEDEVEKKDKKGNDYNDEDL